MLASDKLRDASYTIGSSCRLIMINQAFWGSDHRSSCLALSIYSLQVFSVASFCKGLGRQDVFSKCRWELHVNRTKSTTSAKSYWTAAAEFASHC